MSNIDVLPEHSGMRRVSHVPLCAVATFTTMFALGCASTPPRELTEQIAKTDASIDQARQAGAATGGLPELQMATDKRARAQQELEQHHYDVAMRMAQQAQVDAQYASRKSQADQSIRSAAELQRSNEALRVEAERGAVPAEPATTSPATANPTTTD